MPIPTNPGGAYPRPFSWDRTPFSTGRPTSFVGSNPAAVRRPFELDKSQFDIYHKDGTVTQGRDNETMQRVQDALMPYWSAARENMKAYLADQGLVSSTSGANRMRDEVEIPFAQASNTMYQDILDKQKAAAFAREQFETESSMNLYNLLWSQFFNQWQLKGSDAGLKAPKDFPLFGDLFNSRYTDPYSSSSGPVGDANTEYVPRYSPNQGKTQSAKDSEASQAYQNAYLSFLKQQEANDNAQWKAGFDYTTGQGDKETDPWSIMTDSAILNLQNNPDVSGVKTLSGDELAQAFYSKFNIDVATLASKGDPRAQKLYALIYGHAYNDGSTVGLTQGADGMYWGAAASPSAPLANSTVFSSNPAVASKNTYWSNLSAKGLSPMTPENKGKANFLLDFLPFLRDWTNQK